MCVCVCVRERERERERARERERERVATHERERQSKDCRSSGRVSVCHTPSPASCHIATRADKSELSSTIHFTVSQCDPNSVSEMNYIRSKVSTNSARQTNFRTRDKELLASPQIRLYLLFVGSYGEQQPKQ